MSPILEVASDGKVHGRIELTETLAEQLKLSGRERHEFLPSRNQSLLANRVDWALTHLRQAQVLESPKKGMIQITQRGLELHKAHPSVNNKVLEQFPEFKEFRQKERKEATATIATSASVDPGPGGAATTASTSEISGGFLQTPKEALEWNYSSLRVQLASDLLEQAKNCSPSFFETLVVKLIVAMGYGGSLRDAGMAIGKSGDEGVDGLIKLDRLGLDTVYLQAKRWNKGVVGSPELQKFVGSLEGHHATKGVFITTSKFSDDAKRYLDKISNKKVILIDGERLAELMIEYGIGAIVDSSYVVKRVDQDFFSEE